MNAYPGFTEFIAKEDGIYVMPMNTRNEEGEYLCRNVEAVATGRYEWVRNRYRKWYQMWEPRFLKQEIFETKDLYSGFCHWHCKRDQKFYIPNQGITLGVIPAYKL